MNLICLKRDKAPTKKKKFQSSSVVAAVEEMAVVHSISYACNTDEVAEKSQEIYNELCHLSKNQLEAIRQRTGCYFYHSSYALPQLLLLKGDDNLLSSTHYFWTTLASILISRWTGISVFDVPISYSEASWTGMFDIRKKFWSQQIFDLLGSELFPGGDKLFPDPFGRNYVVKQENGSSYFKRWPLLNKYATFHLGLGDGICANVGSKSSTFNSVAVTIGTSAACRVVLHESPPTLTTDHLKIPAGLWCYRIDDERVLLGGALTDGGCLIEWIRELLGLNNSEELWMDTLSKALHVRSRRRSSSGIGITMAPFLSGERSTGWRVGASGVLSGLTRDTKKEDLVNACIESLCMRIAAIIKLLERFLLNKRIFVSGGAVEHYGSLFLKQYLSDFCPGYHVYEIVVNDSTSRGCFLLSSSSYGDTGCWPKSEEEEFIIDDVAGNDKNKLMSKVDPQVIKQLKTDQERLIAAMEQFWNK